MAATPFSGSELADRQARLILDNAVDYAIVGLDLAGVITSWNVGAERIMQWTAPEAIGCHVDLFFTPEDVEARISQAEMTAAVRHGRGVDERWHLRQDGERFWANGEMMPLRNGDTQLEGYVKILRDRTAQHCTATALSETELRYRSLHDAIDEGFCLIEVQCDDAAKPVDYRFLEVNAAFERQTGLVDAPGSWMRDLAPEHEQHWFDTYANVALTGESVRFALPAQALNGRWYEVFAYRVGEPADRLVSILFSDITERRAGESRLRASEEHLRAVNASLRASESDLRRADRLRIALTELSDRLRDERDPGAISRIAGGIVGETLGADLVGYGVVDPVAETITVEADWTAPGAPSLVGVARFRDYGSYIDDLQAGKTVVVGDAHADPRTQAFADALVARSAASFVNTPVQERGAFVALLYVCHAQARSWNEEELSFIREVAARVRSVIERARSDQALRRLNEHLETEIETRTRERDRLWQTTTDLMGSASYEGYLQAVNPAWTELLGWSESELLGRPFLDIVDPADHAETAEIVARLAQGQSVREFVDRVIDKRGAWHTITWTAVPDSHTGLFNVVGRDVTEQRRTEEALRQSQKMEAVGQLTGGIAHDFNNLLTAVTGGLELLAARIARGEYDKLDRYINMAQTGAHRAAALTQRLLAFSRRQTLAPTPVDADRLIAGMEEIIDRTIGPSIEVRVIATAGLWSVLVDAPQLENALLNLCINARDAMPDGGRITIETANKRLDARAAAERDLPGGEYVVLSVSDTGTGMTPDIVDRVFDPFFTTKPIGQGTGLGLSMVYGFVRQSGGQVRIHSEAGQGTAMHLYLPRHAGDAAMPDADGDGADTPRAVPGETILVVEDEIAIRQLVVELLEEAGYRVLEASTGPAGVKLLQSSERIDLLITDVGLPGGLNGRQVADAGRVVRPELKVLFVTGYAANAAVGAGYLDEGMEVLTKPFNIADLIGRARGLIGG